jgi:endo-1,4-beta-D-glucanase Y
MKMRSTRSLFGILGLGIVTTLAGCSGNNASIVGSGTLGGDVSTGGSIGIGGTTGLGGGGLGGTSSVGGTSGSNLGGSTGASGASNRGGVTSLGGGANTGGSAGIAGSVSTNTSGSSIGGSTAKATGGSSSPGGAATTGGKTGTGGSGVVAAGGTTTGGVATGGAPTGGAATGGLGTGGLWRGPTPPVGGANAANFPFPQNRESPNCIYPTAYRNEDVQAVYTAWKADLVTNQGVGTNCTSCFRVRRPAEPGLQVNSTVSEGIGYGMIIAVYMNDQPLFDGLWRYALAHTWGSTTGSTLLMNWYIAADGNVASTTNGGQDGSGAATDADEDIAWALIMADRQWGGQGSLTKTYLAYAQQLLGDIWKYETINYQLPRNGSTWGDDNCLNISYFAPAYYRVFASVGNEQRWLSNVVPYVYQIVSQSLNAANGNQTDGLVPAFSTNMGATANCGLYSAAQPHNYQYDSCRTPFRIGLDACMNNDSNAASYVAKTSSFFSSQGGASKIVDGYQLNGTPSPQFPGGTYKGLSAAFIGPAGVGAMHTQAGQNYQSFVDDVYGLVRQNNMWTGGQYYDESWTMMSMLMMSGNFLDYTKY